MSKYFIPVLFLFIFIYGAVKKVRPYDAFTQGARSAIPFAFSIFPNLLCIFVLTEISEISGVADFISRVLSPVFSAFGIPAELNKLVLIKPFSGSGALATLSEIYSKYGADGYLSRCASVIYGSSETVFYVAAVYFSGAKTKNLFKPIIISLVASFFSIVFACFICKVM